jgi:phage/plasmid-associated DNA primase
LTDETIGKLDAIKIKSKLVHLLFELVGTWDVTLWLLCQITRAIGALPRFEEFMWLSAVSGNNGKGTLVNILQTVLGSHAEGYYAQLEFERHFLTGNKISNVNNPEIAALEGKRMVVVNETPGIKHGEVNTQLIKRLLSLDAQIQTTAKYKDPTAWTSMMHMLFLANECPKFAKDPALFTRLSYLFLPFEFCENPNPKNKAEKPMDTSVKESIKDGRYNPELLHWGVCLTPYLMEARSSRKIQPQPAAVVEDTASHAVAAESSRDTLKADLAKDFVEKELENYTSALTPPSNRDEINKAFREYAERHGEWGVNTQEALVNSGLLQNHEGNTRFKMMHMGKNIAVYKRKGQVVTLNVDLRNKEGILP